MNRKLLMGGSILILLLLSTFIFLSQPPSSPKTTLILNKMDTLPSDLPKLFFSDISLKKPISYRLSEDVLMPLDDVYVPYTEGFINRTLYEKIYSIFNQYNPSIPSNFHDYYLYNDLAVVAFTGGLENIYLIDLPSSVVFPLLFEESENLGDMYVSHMQVVEDKLIILGGEAHSYSSLIYTVDFKTGEVLSSKRLPTHPSALYEEDFAILSSGECIFVAGNTLKRYNPFSDTTTTMPLPFESTRVLAYEDTGLVFGESEGRLEVLSLDGNIHTTLKMPVIDYRIVDLIAQDQFLYMALFDPAATRYPNYFSIYNLKTGEWLYALGIESLQNQALLFIDY